MNYEMCAEAASVSRTTVNAEPSPGLLRTEISPFTISSTFFHQRQSQAVSFRRVGGIALIEFFEHLCWLCASIPQPVSRTVTNTLLPSVCEVRAMAPPRGVNLIALESRLFHTNSRRDGS